MAKKALKKPAKKKPVTEEIHPGVFYGMKYGKKKDLGSQTFGVAPDSLEY